MRTFIILSLLAGVTWLTFSNSLQNGFVYDDTQQILGNPWLENTTTLKNAFTKDVWAFREFIPETETVTYYRPLMLTIFFVEQKIFGENPIGFHATNLVLHIGLSFLVFVFFRRVLKASSKNKSSSDWVAAIGALLFAVHPINAEVVNWPSAIGEIVFGIAVVTILVIEHKRTIPEWQSVVGMVLFGTALLAKETAVMILPLVMLLHFARKTSTHKTLRKRISATLQHTSYYILMVIVYLFIRLVIFIPAHHDSGLAETLRIFSIYIATVPSLFLHNIALIFFPADLTLFSDWSIGQKDYALSAATIIAAVLVLIFRKRLLRYWQNMKQKNTIVLCVLLFTIPLLPSLNAHFLDFNVLSNRYLYVPSIGFALALMFTERFLWRKSHNQHQKVILVVATTALLSMYIIHSHNQNRVWKDNRTLVEHAQHLRPESLRAQEMRVEVSCGRGTIETCKKELATLEHLREEDLKRRPEEKHETIRLQSQQHKKIVLAKEYFDKRDESKALSYATDVLEKTKSPLETIETHVLLVQILIAQEEYTKATHELQNIQQILQKTTPTLQMLEEEIAIKQKNY